MSDRIEIEIEYTIKIVERKSIYSKQLAALPDGYGWEDLETYEKRVLQAQIEHTRDRLDQHVGVIVKGLFGEFDGKLELPISYEIKDKEKDKQ